MKPSHRRLLPALLLFVSVIGLPVAAALFWLGSDMGRAWLTTAIEARSAGALHLEGLQGHPLSAWSVKQLLYEADGTRMQVDGLALDWNIWFLLKGRIHLRKITAGDVKLSVQPGPSGLDIEALWPVWAVQLDHLSVARVGYQEEGQAYTTFSDVQMHDLVLGKVLSGNWAVDAGDWRMQGRLDGHPESWSSSIELRAASTDAHAMLGIQGKTASSGSLKLQGEQAGKRLALSGDWTRVEGILNAGGELDLQYAPLRHAGIWTLQADIGTGAAETRITGTSNGSDLLRPLDWRISSKREADGRLHGQISESLAADAQAGFQLQWEWLDAGSWLAKGVLQHWQVPLAGAEGHLSGIFSSRYRDTGWKLDAKISEGRMAGLAASLDVQANGGEQLWHVQRADMQILGMRIRATGQGDAGKLQLGGKVTSTELKPLFTFAGIDGSGQLSGDFSITGPPSAAEMKWRADARNIRLAEAGAGRLHSEGKWLHARREGRTSLHASGLYAMGKQWSSLQLRGELGRNAFSLQGNAQGDIAMICQLHGQGGDGVWQGIMSRLDIADDSGEGEAAWLRMRDVAWHVEHGQLSLPRSRLQLLGHQVWLSAAIGRTSPEVDLHITDFPLQSLMPWLEGRVKRLTGKASLRARLTGEWERPLLEMHLDSAGTGMTLPDGEISRSDSAGKQLVGESEPQPLRFRQLHADLSLRPDGFGWKAGADMHPAASLHSHGDIPWRFSLAPFEFRKPAQHAGGQAYMRMDIADLAAFNALLPRFDPLSGKLKLVLVVQHPLEKPELAGKGEFDVPAIGIPELGLDMSGKGSVEWQGDAGTVDVKLASGAGQLLSNGSFSLSEMRFPGVSLQHFQMMNTADQQLVVNGYLATVNRQGYLWLTGELSVDSLMLLLPDIQPSATQDLVWEETGPEAEQFASLRLTRLDVVLDLADHGQISGRGMRMQLGGKLKLGGSIAYPQLSGDMRILSGGIDYRNIHLDVLPDSHVTFTGDPDRPLLHVRAGRTVDGKLFGVAIDGPADRPVSTLFSDPAMPQTEILSYLATGRPLASLGQNAASDAMSLAGFLLGPGGDGASLQEKVQRSLGLDELSVDMGTDKKSLGAAKRIGEKTTVRLEEVVSAQVSTAVTLEYKFTKSLSLFARKVQNLAPMVGLKLSHEWPGEVLSGEGG